MTKIKLENLNSKAEYVKQYTKSLLRSFARQNDIKMDMKKVIVITSLTVH